MGIQILNAHVYIRLEVTVINLKNAVSKIYSIYTPLKLAILQVMFLSFIFVPA